MKVLARTENDLLALVTEHEGTMTGMVTPQVAGWLLRLNTHNRSLNKSRCLRFKSILQRDLWINTGEPIIVSREGTINDGQHRLTAIHETGIAAPMDVRFGIPQVAFHQTGTGDKRSPGEVLGIAGIACGNQCAAVAKWLWHYDNGSISRVGHAVETGDILQTVQNFPIINDVVRMGFTLKLAILKRSWFGAALTLMARRSSLEEVTNFAHAVDDGQGEPNSPTRRLHERLVDEAVKRGKMPPIDRVIISIKAWNAWVERRPIGLLKVIENDRSAGGFPTIATTHESVRGRRKAATT
jgi:hypothetical protein